MNPTIGDIPPRLVLRYRRIVIVWPAPTSCENSDTILPALDRLRAGGSTHGGAGIQLAYDTAIDNFIKCGINRVILGTDGDRNVDTKDAGEIGAGHTVTALYEIVPAGVDIDLPDIDPLKYQTSIAETGPTDETPSGLTPAAQTGELMMVKLRYKEPDEDTSRLIEVAVTDAGLTLADASEDFAFAAAVASFGMLLRGSQYIPDLTYEAVVELAEDFLGEDAHGYRAEFVDLVDRVEAPPPRNPADCRDHPAVPDHDRPGEARPSGPGSHRGGRTPETLRRHPGVLRVDDHDV